MRASPEGRAGAGGDLRRAEAALRAVSLRSEALGAVARAALYGAGLQPLLDDACAHTARALDAERAAVLELLPDGAALVLRAGHGHRREDVGRATVPARGPVPGARVLSAGGPLAVENLRRDARFRLPPLYDEPPTAGYLGIALRPPGRPYGLLEVHSARPRLHGREDAEFVQSVADLLTAAIARARAEEALRESEERYRILFERNPQPMWLSDAESLGFLAVNEAAVRVYGFSREEFLSMTAREIRPREDVPALMESVGRLRRGINFPGVWRHRRKDGTLMDVEVVTSSLDLAGRPAHLVLAQDVTERRRLQEEILKASRIESVGVLAAGIAHDFNNIITAVLGNILLAKAALRPGDPAHRRLQDAEAASLRARDLTKQLLTFSKGGEPVKTSVALGDVARDTALFALRGSNVRFEPVLAADLWPVEVDEGQVRQVIHNLVQNARQAMPGGGTLALRTENVVLAQDDAEVRPPLPAWRYVRLSVEDQGVGIPGEIVGRIFDPYFTTRQGGSGLGLAVAYSVVAKHEGRITVVSRLGRGSTFCVYLPASAAAASPHAITARAAEPAPARGAAAPSSPDPPASPGARGRVLVMDDEEMIQQVTGGLLRLCGYDSDAAADGAAAVALYEQARRSGRPYDAVILDLTVPSGIGGRETLARLRALDPGVRAIVASGYSDDPILSDYRRHGFRGGIAKPFGMEELIQALRLALEVAGNR